MRHAFTYFNYQLDQREAFVNELQTDLKSDRILESVMQSETILSSLFAPIFDNGAGSGMALLYVSCAIAMFSIGAIALASADANAS